jgi:23S rRNA (adenine2503-C2)-methyltransferase
LKAHINLIPVNPVKERGYRHPDDRAVRAFKNKLEKHGINVSIRRVLGRDIDGACGQLRHRHLSEDGQTAD